MGQIRNVRATSVLPWPALAGGLRQGVPAAGGFTRLVTSSNARPVSCV
jgi:hypothetical protein